MLANQKKKAAQGEALHPVQHVVPDTNIDTDKLRELKSLLDDGVISQADFDTAKKKILGL
ncbi:MAG: SHOCT domain-containing protein [Oscillospiraceae bacterium]|nr:SHOCT domain-containing protein [Oscillospiraceae bacterium]